MKEQVASEYWWVKSTPKPQPALIFYLNNFLNILPMPLPAILRAILFFGQKECLFWGRFTGAKPQEKDLLKNSFS